ncbi:MAG: alcohol dehydrogenase catalytic domain-containing protein, partial [Chloroflexi bacterium]|nr:alcohol dehydrogenase catalytic domain-containing protein [Chloroflexota bacterium]
MQAIRIHEFGGPEVLRLEEIPVPEPGDGQALVRLEAIGLNFIDVYNRMGAYPSELPLTLGREGAGVVEAVGANVTEVKAGDRVAFAMTPGSYAEYAVVEATKLAPVPDGVSSEQAAGVMLQGMTAHYLTRHTYPLSEGESCLVHAAAGGV